MVFQACIFVVHIDMACNQVANMGFAKEKCVLKRTRLIQKSHIIDRDKKW
jgi:hypothetical protein